MDFPQLDKYDLFNAPQYVDFNQFILNDGFSNDNADKFFETHKEEDDFFPAELTGGTIIPTTFGDANEPEPETTTTAKVAAVNSVQSQGVQKGADVTEEIVKVKVEGQTVKPYAIEINYEEVANLKTETAKAEKLKRIMEIEAAERLKVKERLEQAERKYEAQIAAPAAAVPVKVPYHSENVEVPKSEQVCKDETEDIPLPVPTEVPVHIEDPVRISEVVQQVVEEERNYQPESLDMVVSPKEKKRAKSVQIKLTPTVRRSRSLTTSRLSKKPDNTAGKDADRSAIPDSAKQMKNTLSAIPKSVPKVTIPKPFKFSETRVRKTHNYEPEKDYKFKAKPMPMKAFQGAPAPAVKPPPKVTQPMDFHFASEDRIRERNMKRSSVPNATDVQPPQELASKTKSGISSSRTTLGSACSSTEKMSVDGSCPGSAKKVRIRPRSLSADRNRAIHVQPFSFEERDKELMRRKEEKIRKLIEEQSKVKEFHAQPLPDFNKAQKHMPPKPVIPVTAVKPFALKCDQRGAHYQEELQRKLEEEKARLRQLAEFHAHPASVVHRKPFVPEKSSTPLVEPLNLQLSTDRRAEDRAKYDDMIKQKEAELEALRKQEQMLREEQEKKLAQALRQMRIHKAKPLPKSKIFEIKHSERPLTEPKSPAFAPLPSERRAKQVENKENINNNPN